MYNHEAINQGDNFEHLPESFCKICGVIKKKINEQNKSHSLLFVGEMGSGKSLAAVSCAAMIDPSFVKTPRVVFNVKDFLKVLNDAKKGQCVIFDEAGVGVPARDWQSQQNKIMSIISQILRFKNICIIFTTPSMRFIDINVRSMLNSVVKMKAIDFEHNVSYSKYNVIKVIDDGRITNQDFIFYGPNEEREIIDPFIVPRPPEALNKWYDNLSMEFKNKTIRELMLELNGEAGDNPGTLTPAAVKKIQRQANTCISLINLARNHYTWADLEKYTGVNERSLQEWTEGTERTKKQLNVYIVDEKTQATATT